MTQRPTSTIGIGIIGAGFARTTQIPAFQVCEGARVVSIASGRRENAERVAREFGIAHATGDWREVISRDDVQLVSVVTPPSTHAEVTLAALDAGKAVLCEKPMAMNADETDRMRRRAHESGQLAHIDHELRFLPARRKMRDLIRTGDIGEIRHAKLLFRSDSRVALRGWNWWSDRTSGGGVLGAIGSHAVDTLQWITGGRISRVSALLATHVIQRPDQDNGEMRAVTTDDEASLLVEFAPGSENKHATGVISMSVVESGRPEHTVQVFGSEGALMVESSSRLSRATAEGGQWIEVETEPAPLAAKLRDNEWSRGFTVFARELVAALREGRRSVEGAATFDDGHRIQLVLDAARNSHHAGCRVTIGE